MSAADAAGLGTVTEYASSEDRIQSELNALAGGLTQAADRVLLIVEYETRMRTAAQVRFVGVLVKTGAMSLEAGAVWITAATRMLEAYNRVDLDEVYADRVARRYGQ